MIKKALFYLFFIHTLFGCSFFSQKVEQLAESDQRGKTSAQTTKFMKKNLFCSEAKTIQFILEDEATLKFYTPLIKPIFENKSLNFAQKAAIFSLLEMSRRPDESSPTSRLQFFIRINNQDYYFDVRPKNLENNQTMSYLKGIEILLSNFGQGKSLSRIAESIDHLKLNSITVSAEFENFLKKHKKDFEKNEDLSNFFLKGDEAITKHESFKYIPFKRIIDIYDTQKFSNDLLYEHSKNMLFSQGSFENDKAINCNLDINKKSLRDDLFYNDRNNTHTFGLKEGNNFFLAASSSVLQRPLQSFAGTYFFKTRPAPTALPICHFKSATQELVLFSTKGRNPAQHINHLISYELNSIESFSSLIETLNFSRHLFLENPDRILYESKRGRKAQLDFFLSMNFPIYHVEKMGNIMGHATFKNKKYEMGSLFIDDRGNDNLWCGK